MKKAIIIHEWSNFENWKNPKRPSPSSAGCVPWLSKQLMINETYPITIEYKIVEESGRHFHKEE